MTTAEVRCALAWLAGLVALVVALLEWRDQRMPS